MRMFHLYKDCLHLNNCGKDELTNNFIDNRYYFTGKYFLDERCLDRQCVKRKGLP